MTKSARRNPGKLATLATLCAAVLWALPSKARGQVEPFHILLTNDDGIESPGIQQLARALREVGEVHLVAPCGERSGSSMAIALRDELAVENVDVEGVGPGKCVDTTPAGAVLLAISSLAPADGFDLVVSGLNRGANVGEASHMSGTVGGAMMGALHQIPAIAASFGARSLDYHYAAQFVADFASELKRHPPMPGIVFSINIPRASESETQGVKVASMGGMHLTLGYSEAEGSDGSRFRPRIGLSREAPPGSDTEAYLQDMITITPLRFDWTAKEIVEVLRRWGLTHRLRGH